MFVYVREIRRLANRTTFALLLRFTQLSLCKRFISIRSKWPLKWKISELWGKARSESLTYGFFVRWTADMTTNIRSNFKIVLVSNRTHWNSRRYGPGNYWFPGLHYQEPNLIVIAVQSGCSWLQQLRSTETAVFLRESRNWFLPPKRHTTPVRSFSKK